MIYSLIKILLSVCIIIYSVNAFAFGIGMYAEGGYGLFRTNYSSYSMTESFKESKNYFGGAGVTFDSGLHKHALMSYRLKLAGEFFNSEYETKAKGYRAGMSNVFCFTLLMSNKYKLWLGPQIGLKYVEGDYNRSYFGFEYSDATTMMLSGIILSGQIFKESVKYSLIGFDLGPSIGINLKTRKNYSVSLETGCKYVYYNGKVNRKAQVSLTAILTPQFSVC